MTSLASSSAGGRSFGRIALPTDAVHLTRAAALARLLGREVVLVAAGGKPCAPAVAEQVPMHLREMRAWWRNPGKAAAWIALGLLGCQGDRARVIR